MAYVFQRPAKDGKVRFTAMYKAENGKYRSAGTYDNEDRAQQVADESERHAHLRLAETSPAEKATITVEEFMPKFLSEHAIEPNSRQRYAEVLRSHAIPYIGRAGFGSKGYLPSRSSWRRACSSSAFMKPCRTSRPRADQGLRAARRGVGRAAMRADLVHARGLRLRHRYAERQ